MKTSPKTVPFYLVFVLFLSLAGCDQVSKLTQYFKEDKAVSPPPKSVNQAVKAKAAPAVKPPEQAATKDVVARVGSWTLTKADLDQRLKAIKELAPELDLTSAEQRQEVVEELVRQELLIQDAERTGVADEKEIRQAVEEFRRTLLVRRIAAKITDNVTVTEQDAQEYYEANRQDFVEPAQWRIREVVVKGEKEARDILVEFYKGADFMDLVKQYSQAKSAWKKGDVGFVSEFGFPKMQKIVSTLDVGEVSGVFEGPEGYYIVKLEEKKGGQQMPFDKVKEEIQAGLTMLRQQQAILDYLENLRQKTTVNINNNLIAE